VKTTSHQNIRSNFVQRENKLLMIKMISINGVLMLSIATIVLIQHPNIVDGKPCRPKVVPTADTRPGRCPHPQYAFSSLPCSVEGNDTVCPWNYKCCPLTQGMQCFAPCIEWAKPCNIKCEYGLEVNPSPCTICKCAEDPCLSRTCPRGTSCKVKEYEPCAFKGKCGYTTECVKVPSNVTEPITKPKRCPDYWPQMFYQASSLVHCDSSDAECPGDQKCCEGPAASDRFGSYPGSSSSDGPVSYCADPCESLDTCTLNCPLGLQVEGGCQICQCAVDACLTTTCPPGKKCQLLPAPCAHYPGMPPCPKLPVCM